ncbi:MAG: response regulator [Deltaproteobacteria bacterium]|nr:response regulator [Deltaproteobacteria bacterium]
MPEDVSRIFLLPGEYMVSKKPYLISTILGSCISVCLYHPQHRCGGMNHYMLPRSPSGERSGKYGEYANNLLLQFMERTCGGFSGVEGMITGGANVVREITRGGELIGDKNIALAREMLRKHNIKVIREQVGGEVGRKLHYQNWDNKLIVEPMTPSATSGSLLVRADSARSQASAPAKPAAAKPAGISAPAPGRNIKVLIVDDSAIVRNLLAKAMSGESDITVVGQAKDAFEAREMLLELGPDVMTLDIIMPKMDGVTFLKKIMVYHPLPVIICSTIAKKGSQTELRSDKIGAVDILDKETLNLYSGLETVKKILVPKIRAAARTVVHKKTKEEVGSL